MATTSNLPRERNAEQMGSFATPATATLADKACAGAAEVAEKAKKTAAQVTQAAGDAAQDLGHKADDTAANMGSGMQSLAQNIREHAPKTGVVGTAATAVAGTLDRGGRYLETEKLSGMADDFTDLIRKNPIPALLVGIGLGYLLARATRR